MIREPDLSDVYRYADEVRNSYQQQLAQIQLNINEAGIGAFLK